MQITEAFGSDSQKVGLRGLKISSCRSSPKCFSNKLPPPPIFCLLKHFHLQWCGKIFFLFIFKVNHAFTAAAVKLRLLPTTLVKPTDIIFYSDDIGNFLGQMEAARFIGWYQQVAILHFKLFTCIVNGTGTLFCNDKNRITVFIFWLVQKLPSITARTQRQ
jgi:hypothetical protein